MKNYISFFSNLISFLCLLNISEGVCQDAKRPNVLFIICDDLNDYEGVFGGHPQALTPNIDKLAASGVRFINAQSNVPVCSPSRNSLLTGVYPHQSGDFGWTDLKKQPVLKNNKTLIRFFQENGYYTLGTGKISHSNISEDWDEWGLPLKYNYGPVFYDGNEVTAHPEVPEPYHGIGPIDGSFGSLAYNQNLSDKKNHSGWVYGKDLKPMNYVTDQERDPMQDELHANWAIRRINELSSKPLEKPFFMGLGFVRPHTPLHAPQKYFDKFPIKNLILANWIPHDTTDTFYENNFDISKDNKGLRYFDLLVQSFGGDRDLALKHFLQAYLACVAFVDEQVGKVIEALNNSSLASNTIVVFTSDHGWQMGEKNYLFKNSPWEESARIPMIIKPPKLTGGKQVEQPVALIDIFPTLADYCDLSGFHTKNENGGKLGGFSLRPLIEGNTKWQGPQGALTVVGNYGNEVAKEKQNYSYRTKRYRYIIYNNGQEELYDHENDPYEWENVAENIAYKKVKAELANQVQALLQS